MYRHILFALALIFCASAVCADNPGDKSGTVVIGHACRLWDGEVIDAGHPLAVAATAATTRTMAIGVTKCVDQSARLTLDAGAATVAVTAELKGSDDGITFYSFDPAKTKSFTGSGTKWWSLSLPVCPYVAFFCSSDASNPTTWTAAKVYRW